MATAEISIPETTSEPLTLEDLARLFGPMPPGRIRWQPAPGTATERDCRAILESKTGICELIDGVLVNKVMGYKESRLAFILGLYLEAFGERSGLGVAMGADAASRILPSQIRVPDVSFVYWSRLPNREIPNDPIPHLVPDLAVEVLSRTNTVREMDRKLHDYFTAGVPLVWYVDPPQRRVRVFTALDQCEIVHEAGTLSGGTVLPGFQLTLREWFARAERPSPPAV